MKITTRSTAETQALARTVAAAFPPHTRYALYGDLGAGKTCFVQGLTAGLGIRAMVTSPTFTIANEYRDPDAKKRFLHLDLYRLSGPDELDSIGWEDYLASGDPMAIEWPERAGDFLPPDTVRIEIRIGENPDTRIFTILPPGESSDSSERPF